MSWDILIFNLPDVNSMGELAKDYKPPVLGTREELIAKIKQLLPQLDSSNPEWCVLDAGDFSIEINMGEKEETDCITCHIHGSGGGGACISELVKFLGFKAFDTTTGELLDLNNPNLGYDQWLSYYNKHK